MIFSLFFIADAIWRTDLDWVVLHRDRLVVLGFMNPSGNLSTLGGMSTQTAQPFVTSSPYKEDDEEINEDEEGGRDERITEYPVTTPPSKIIVSMAHESSMKNNKNPGISSFGTTVKSSSGTQPIGSRLDTRPTVSSLDGTLTVSTIRDFVTTRKGNLPNTIATTTNMPVQKSGATVTTLGGTKSSRSAVTTAGKISTGASGKNSSRNDYSRSKSRLKNGITKPISTKLSPANKDGNITSHSLQLVMNSLADLDHPDELNIELRSGELFLSLFIS